MKILIKVRRLAVWLSLCALVSVSGQPSCPAECTCKRSSPTDGLIVDCAAKGLQEIPDNLDPDTYLLDLSRNSIRRIKAGAFSNLHKVSIINLEDNDIEDIEAFAFKGVSSLERVSLRRNNLSRIRTNAFVEMSGAAGICGTGLRRCSLDLQENHLELVEEYGFAWIQYLDILIGDGLKALTIQPYAFYGCRDVSLLSLGSVPELALAARAFTNTERVGQLRVHNTRLTHISPFHFEGLSHVGSIVFDKVALPELPTSAFSGIKYPPRGIGGGPGDTITYPEEDAVHYASCGGQVLFVGSVIREIHADAFQDTNLHRITVRGAQVDHIAGHAFRGLSCLGDLMIETSQLYSLAPHALGGLNRVYKVSLLTNKLSSLPRAVFRSSQNISSLSISIRPGDKLMLESHAFSGLVDVGQLDIFGRGTGEVLKISPDAFSKLSGVMTVIVRDVDVGLGQHTLRGMARVHVVRVARVNVTGDGGVSEEVFGNGNAVGVERFTLNQQSPPPCDSCPLVWLSRHLSMRLPHFSTSCRRSGFIIKVTGTDNLGVAANRCIMAADGTSGQEVSRGSTRLLAALLMLIWMVLL